MYVSMCMYTHIHIQLHGTLATHSPECMQVVIAVLLEQFSAAAHKMKEPFSLTETFIRRPNPFRAVHQSLMACQVLVCVCVCVCVCVYTNIYIHMNRCMRAVHQSRMACQILNPKSGTTFQSGPSNPSPCMYVRIVVYLCMCLYLCVCVCVCVCV